MSLTVEDVQRWDPGAVREVGDAARTRAQTSIDTANELPKFPDWTGPGSQEAKQALEKSRQALMRDADAALAAARSADAAAVNVQIVKDNLQQVLNMAIDCGMVVDPVSGTVLPGPGTLGLPNDWHNAEILQQAIQQVLTQADTVDAQLAAAMDRADDVVDVPPEARPIPLPPPKAGAEDVNQWWQGLSQKDRERLIAEHPAELGNLNGIPAAARDVINQQVLTDDLNKITNIASQHGVSKEQVLGDPGFYGLSAEDVTRYKNALKVQQGLDHQRGSDSNTSRQRPVVLWRYEPLADKGEGRAAIAIGNPDYADNTTIIVPGTGSSVQSGWLSGPSDAKNLWDQANAADPNSTHSMISWMAYDAPDGFTDMRIAHPDLARTGGDLLAADINGLGVTHRDFEQHMTVIGHSYGSTTVADAFAHSGMHANDAVLLGCPGTDYARSAADFHVDGGHVYVGAASSDPISYLGTPPGVAYDIASNMLGNPVGADPGLGLDPAGDEFGSIRFDAEVPGRDGLDRHHHSHYYDIGSESLRAMTYIATGESGELGGEGLLAGGRRQPHIDLPTEIDLPLGGKIDLPPVGFDIPGSPAYIDPEADRPSESVTKDHAF